MHIIYIILPLTQGPETELWDDNDSDIDRDIDMNEDPTSMHHASLPDQLISPSKDDSDPLVWWIIAFCFCLSDITLHI